MTADPKSIDLSTFVSEHLERAEPDLLRSMLQAFVEALMGAEADAICGAPYGARSPERTNSRNGYRAREWDTRTGSVELALPKLRTGSRTRTAYRSIPSSTTCTTPRIKTVLRRPIELAIRYWQRRPSRRPLPSVHRWPFGLRDEPTGADRVCANPHPRMKRRHDSDVIGRRLRICSQHSAAGLMT